jgi:CheY-like chemotaxis protein
MSKSDALIIEDEPEIAENIKTMLEMTGIYRNILISKDGADAVNKLQKQSFSLITLDLSLPKRDGMAIINDLKQIDPKLLRHVLIISGYIGKDTIKMAQTTGIKHMITKPFDTKELITKVATINKTK